jgi:Flp pilus assembly protein TadB
MGVLLIAGLIAHIILPNFNLEKRYASQATSLAKSNKELIRSKKDPVVLYVAERWIPKLSNLKIPIFNGKLKRMHNLLGNENTFEEELADKALKSLFGSLPFLVLPFILGLPALFLAAPIMIAIFFFAQLTEIKKAYKRRQAEIIRDLPQLISKMMITLETGKSFMTTIQRLEETSGPRMKKMLSRLNSNIRIMKLTDAVDLFAAETDVPVMRDFAAAIKIGVNSGYGEAKKYFDSIKGDLRKLRLAVLKDQTRSEPEKIKWLYILVAVHAFAAVIIAFVDIFSQAQNL